MKKLMLLFIGLAVLASCSKDDSTPPDTNPGGGDTTEATLRDSVQGNWSLVQAIHYDSVLEEEGAVKRDTSNFEAGANFIHVKDSTVEANIALNDTTTIEVPGTTTYDLNTDNRSITINYLMPLNLQITSITDSSLTVYLSQSDENRADTTWFYLTK